MAHWTCWQPGYAMARLVGMIAGRGPQRQGQIGAWSWVRIPCSYPEVAFWNGYDTDPQRSDDWVGMLKMRHPDGKEFLLFSYMGVRGAVGWSFLASTRDVKLLEELGQTLEE